MSPRRANRRGLCAALVVGAALTAGAAAQLPVEVHRNQHELLPSADPTLAANKRLVFDFSREVLQAHQADRAALYVAEDYVEHDPTLPSGLPALIERTRAHPQRAVKETIDELVAIVAERDLVTVATRRELLDLAEEGQTYTTTWFDLYRIADGKIVEHWNFGPRD